MKKKRRTKPLPRVSRDVVRDRVRSAFVVSAEIARTVAAELRRDGLSALGDLALVATDPVRAAEAGALAAALFIESRTPKRKVRPVRPEAFWNGRPDEDVQMIVLRGSVGDELTRMHQRVEHLERELAEAKGAVH